MLLTVCSKTADSEVLKGKYSESFVSEMARQITEEISRAMAVIGLDRSTLELQLPFEPGTFMEHTSENVTYRRLLITDKLCQPRDFWVKWTRLDGAVAYTVSDDVTSDDIKFEIGEDVPQKIREKEYRFLCFTDADKYQSAMSKKTATEWRELIKRAVKRGDIEKVEIEERLTPAYDDVNDKLAKVLGISNTAEVKEENEVDSGFDKVMEMARAAIASYNSEPEAEEVEEVILPTVEEAAFEPVAEEAAVEATEDVAEVDAAELAEDEDAEEEEAKLEEGFSFDSFFDDAPAEDEDTEAEEDIEEKEETMADTYNEDFAKLAMERMRAELEAKIRLEYEEKARAEAEEEARRLRAENERLLEAARLAKEEKEALERERLEAEEKQRQEALERERLLEAARQAEEERERRERELREAEELRRREEALRLQIQEQMRKEAEERERLAEAARQAEIESARLEREKREAEERHRKEEEELRVKLEEKARKEAAEKDRLAEAARQAVLEQRKRELEEAEARKAAAAQTSEEPAKPAPKAKAADTFTSHATIMFRKPVDMEVINKIQKIIEQTLVENKKESVPMHLKAYQVDDTTVGLDIIRLPNKEKDLIVVLMKALGNGHIGISKITVE